MPTTFIPDAGDVITGLVEMLAVATGLPVGDGEAPSGDPTYPYLVVTVVPGGYSDGDLSNPDSMLAVTAQVTGVGRRRDQAHKAGERARQAILARDETGGWVNPIESRRSPVIGRTFTASGGVDREGRVYNAVSLYELTVTVGA